MQHHQVSISTFNYVKQINKSTCFKCRQLIDLMTSCYRRRETLLPKRNGFENSSLILFEFSMHSVSQSVIHSFIHTLYTTDLAAYSNVLAKWIIIILFIYFKFLLTQQQQQQPTRWRRRRKKKQIYKMINPTTPNKNDIIICSFAYILSYIDRNRIIQA